MRTISQKPGALYNFLQNFACHMWVEKSASFSITAGRFLVFPSPLSVSTIESAFVDGRKNSLLTTVCTLDLHCCDNTIRMITFIQRNSNIDSLDLHAENLPPVQFVYVFTLQMHSRTSPTEFIYKGLINHISDSTLKIVVKTASPRICLQCCHWLE